jgi:hypothetical protein
MADDYYPSGGVVKATITYDLEWNGAEFSIPGDTEAQVKEYIKEDVAAAAPDFISAGTASKQVKSVAVDTGSLQVSKAEGSSE